MSPSDPIGRAPADDKLPAFARLHGTILAASWLLATSVALYAYTAAPMAIDGAAALETMAALRRAWPWYTLCYALFLVTDCAIALLGVLLMAWLAPQGGYRAWAMVVLFALAGMLGLAMDVVLLTAAQLFRSSSLLGDAASIAAVLGWLNAITAWFSAASFALSGGASLLVAPLALDRLHACAGRLPDPGQRHHRAGDAHGRAGVGLACRHLRRRRHADPGKPVGAGPDEGNPT